MTQAQGRKTGVTFVEMYHACVAESERLGVWLDVLSAEGKRPDPAKAHLKLVFERAALVFDLIADDKAMQTRLADLKQIRDAAKSKEQQEEPDDSSVRPSAGAAPA